MIYDSSGVLVPGSLTESNSAYTIYIATTTLASGNVCIAYSDVSNSGYGCYVICSDTGDIFRESGVFEKVDSNEVQLHIRTDETLELLLSANL